ncbi:MAG: hypothetical protein II458_06490 [Oscillospiraceae bacterium]|nr:hypothetical protein [Oscillospiraceae bacterium]
MDQNPVIMQARVLRVQRDILLVRDCRTGQNVQVNTSRARRFRAGQKVIIQYSGAMTMSIPPQISAMEITPAARC